MPDYKIHLQPAAETTMYNLLASFSWRRSEVSQDQCAEAEELEPRNTRYAGGGGAEGRGGERQRERVRSLALRRESRKLFPANVRPSKQRMP